MRLAIEMTAVTLIKKRKCAQLVWPFCASNIAHKKQQYFKWDRGQRETDRGETLDRCDCQDLGNELHIQYKLCILERYEFFTWC